MEQKTITLESPIQRGETEIREITLRKPKAGELRGLSLSELLNMDVGSIIKVLPRISEPALTEHEVAQLDAVDLTQMASEVAGFLLTKARLAEIQSQIESNQP